MNAEDIEFFCDELSKSSNEYLQDTKEILCGKDKEIQFFIKNEIFEWKKNVWTLGRIKLSSISDVKIISEGFQKSLKFYQDIQDKVDILEKENKILTDEKNKLSSDIEKMIETKTAMEQDLYSKFILILNSKKEKLRELESMVKERQKPSESVFDACTDESEGSDNENKKNNISIKQTVLKKRKFTVNNNSEATQNAKKEHITINNDHINDKKTHESCASGNRNSRNSLNFTEMKEEELFSE